jgi:hypothetical protein
MKFGPDEVDERVIEPIRFLQGLRRGPAGVCGARACRPYSRRHPALLNVGVPERGRGLLIIDRLASTWGRSGNAETGWITWFEMEPCS